MAQHKTMNVEIKQVKIFVTVPADYLVAVQTAAWQNGAGVIGDYQQCSYVVSGEGTFLPGTATHPFIGQPNQMETVAEVKLEVICPVDQVRQVVNAIRKIHPYETPAIDIVPLLDEQQFN